MSCIQTHNSRAFDFPAALRGEPQPIVLDDIAHALAHQCRFTGHTQRHYSIAQHSVLVAQLTVKWAAHAGVERRHLRAYFAAGLMHDAAEAYIGDVSRPLKHVIRDHTDIYSQLEDAIEAQIEARFGLTVTEPMRVLVKRADVALLYEERRQLLPGSTPRDWGHGSIEDGCGEEITIAEWSPVQAKAQFLLACADAGVCE